ncbi:MAG: alcohol dehydrogenase catalytic domain-containing protein [Actinomycetota bacterium]
MRAVRFYGVGKPLEIEDRPVPEPGPGEVLVKVAACGICASDVHMFDGTLPTRGTPPFIPGHEASGVVESIGPGVDAWQDGDRVAIFPGKRCGACARCRNGEPIERCMFPANMGIEYDGGWAEYVAVPQEALVRVPASVPLDVAAILCDAVATPFNAVLDTGGLRPGERVAVFGIGGLGTHGVMLARLGGASFVAAVDVSPAARERAKRLGADVTIDPAAVKASDAIREVTGGEGVDLAIDFVGANSVLKEAVASLAIDGRAMIVGVSGDRIQLGPSALFAVLRNKLLSVMGYQRKHLETLVSLVASGRLDVSGSISARLPFEQASGGVAMLTEKRGDPVRIVLTP